MPATSSRACSTADRDHRPDDADALAQATDDQVGLTSGELAHLVLVDDLPGPSATHSVPARAASCGVRNRQDAAGGREQPGALLLAAERDAGLASEDDTGAGGQGAGSTPPRAATAPRRPPAAHVRPISSTARAPVTPPAAAKRPRDTQPTRTTQAPATQPAMPAGRPGAGSGRRAGSRRAVGRG